MKIRILPEASRDLELGADFYESQNRGLGRYFNDSLMADIESLQIYGWSPREVSRFVPHARQTISIRGLL